jgi:uncharacterized membrane protein
VCVFVACLFMAEMSNNDCCAGTDESGDGEFALFTRRLHALNARQCSLAFGSLAAFSLIVAVVFSALGAWLILPFAGLEAVALYFAYRWVMRHAQDSEQLVIRGDAVTLAVHEQSHTRQYEFNRAWAQLVVQQQARVVRVALRSHGKEVEVGRYLDNGSKHRLARALKVRLNAR